ncbi:hypothetical protein [Magnetofaba australis]|uniref:Uncharacterized protein n=1 Tax=Magnetofaba australis IT-1 TaxID=1434232 RepID=A0A1Y2K3F2_9PROT|nr:hypothetical protein [Magnetofaba australis]OSM01555.1 hypothetical protein MAIT1_01551 [Magnetofaba australis IT-1]
MFKRILPRALLRDDGRPHWRQIAAHGTQAIFLLAALAAVIVILILGLPTTPGAALLAAAMAATTLGMIGWALRRIIQGPEHTPKPLPFGPDSSLRQGWNWAINHLVLRLRAYQPGYFLEPPKAQTEASQRSGFARILTAELAQVRQPELAADQEEADYYESLELLAAARETEADEEFLAAMNGASEALQESTSEPGPEQSPEPPLEIPSPPAPKPPPPPQDDFQENPDWMQRKQAWLERQLESRQAQYDEEIERVYAEPIKPRAVGAARQEEAPPSPLERLREAGMTQRDEERQAPEPPTEAEAWDDEALWEEDPEDWDEYDELAEANTPKKG